MYGHGWDRKKVLKRLILVFQDEHPLAGVPIWSPSKSRYQALFAPIVDGKRVPVDGVIDAAAATLDGKSYVHLVMHAWAHPGEDSQRWGRISEVCREKAPRPFSVPLRVTGRDHARFAAVGAELRPRPHRKYETPPCSAGKSRRRRPVTWCGRAHWRRVLHVTGPKTGPPHWRGGYTQLGEWIATPSSCSRKTRISLAPYPHPSRARTWLPMYLICRGKPNRSGMGR
jgi:hypothetical protein